VLNSHDIPGSKDAPRNLYVQLGKATASLHGVPPVEHHAVDVEVRLSPVKGRGHTFKST
jgi:hypothetical protein